MEISHIQITHQEIYIWQQVEDILQLVDDLVVNGKLACCHSLQVGADVQQLRVKSLQAVNLICDALRQSAHCGVLDIPVHGIQQMKVTKCL